MNDSYNVDYRKTARALLDGDESYSDYGDTVPRGQWDGREVWHGTGGIHADSIRKGIQIPLTGGYFGNAFYVADNPGLAWANYADFAGDDDDGPPVVLKFRIKPGSRILDLRVEKDAAAWDRISEHGRLISFPDFHLVMQRNGIDGLFDRSVGGLAIYNPGALEYLGEEPRPSK